MRTCLLLSFLSPRMDNLSQWDFFFLTASLLMTNICQMCAEERKKAEPASKQGIKQQGAICWPKEERQGGTSEENFWTMDTAASSLILMEQNFALWDYLEFTLWFSSNIDLFSKTTTHQTTDLLPHYPTTDILGTKILGTAGLVHWIKHISQWYISKFIQAEPPKGKFLWLKAATKFYTDLEQNTAEWMNIYTYILCIYLYICVSIYIYIYLQSRFFHVLEEETGTRLDSFIIYTQDIV